MDMDDQRARYLIPHTSELWFSGQESKVEASIYFLSPSLTHSSHILFHNPQSTPQIPKKIHLSLAKQILFTIQLPFFQTTECVSIAVSSPTTPPSKEPQIYIIPHSNLQHHHSDSWLHHFLTPIPVLDHPPLSQHHRNYNYNPHHHTQRRHR
jgi:hypothetical protein